MRSKILMTIAIVAGVIAIGYGIAFWAARGGASSPPVAQVPHVDPAPAPPANTPDDSQQNAQMPVPQPGQAVSPQPAPVVQTSNPASGISNSLATGTNWDEKIDDIIASDDPDTNKVKRLYALFPTLPPDQQEEVVQHLSNLVDDDNYGPLADMLKDPKLSDGVLDELLADALNRPNSLKLPALLSVAEEPDNSKHDEAKDLLELYLGQDYGTNWSDWQANMSTWLQQNPD